MRRALSRLVPWAMCAAFFVAVVVLVFCVVGSESGTALMGEGRVQDLNEGWMRVEEDGNTTMLGVLPVTMHAAESVTITRTLPASTADDVLFFFSSYQRVRAWVDGTLILDSGSETALPIGQEPGVTCNLAPLDAGESGRTLTMTYSPHYYGGGTLLREIQLGSRVTIVLSLLASSMGVVILGLVLVVVSLGFMIMVLLRSALTGSRLKADYLYLSLTILCAAVWMLTDDVPFSLFFGGGNVQLMLSLLSFTLLPIPLLLFVRCALDHGRETLSVLCAALIANFGVQVALYVSGAVSMISMLPVTHGMLILTICIVTILCFREQFKYKNKRVRGINWAWCALVLSSALALALFYRQGTRGYSSVFRAGLMMFALILTATVFSESLTTVRRSTQANTYRHMAYTDMMTGLENRTAYERKLEHIREQAEWGDALCVAAFDLNGLKQTNDTWGHQAGDDLIIKAARMIQGAFPRPAYCYRVGGDEFVVLVPDGDPVDFQKRIQRFGASLQCRPCEGQRPVDLAIGHACGTVTGPEDVRAIVMRADAAMYEAKKRERENG